MIKKFFLAQGAQSRWLMPVNMHKMVPVELAQGNCFAAIILRMEEDTGIDALHQSIRDQLKAQHYWPWWWLMRLPGYIGTPLAAQLFKYYYAKKYHMTGFFSNIGNWNGKLVLSMQIHPTLVNTREQVDFYCAQWAVELRELIHAP
jgi:hypothetical protein